LEDIFEEFGGLVCRHSLDVMGDFPAVLVVHTEVRSPAFGVRNGTVGLDGIARHG
jgi:hypothetical protein